MRHKRKDLFNFTITNGHDDAWRSVQVLPQNDSKPHIRQRLFIGSLYSPLALQKPSSLSK